MHLKKLIFALSFLILLSSRSWARGDYAANTSGSTESGTAQSGQSADDKVGVDAIKEKYWARGDESELGVVQDRLYTKDGKLGLSLFGGNISSDPFLTTYNAGASLGYYFSEYLAVQATAWKSFASGSSALTTLQQTLNATADTNKARGYAGAEVQGSLIYGKISLLGKKIIHYDLHLLAGMGATFTETGTDATPSIGIGQQIYLTRSMGLLIDYRAMYYREAIVEKEIPSLLGQVVGNHNNLSNVVTIGVVFLLGGGA